MKKILLMLVLLLLLTGCTEKKRISTIDTIAYSDSYVTITFKDGLVLQTHLYDDDLEVGDEVVVRHKSNGDVVISKH